VGRFSQSVAAVGHGQRDLEGAIGGMINLASLPPEVGESTSDRHS